MIIKLESISHTYNALDYCERGGELLYTHKCLGKTRDIYDQMSQVNEQNTRCKKHTFHIKFRLSPEDNSDEMNLDIEKNLEILHRYAMHMNYHENMYAIYIHKEGTPEQHFHVVASRIMENNKAVSDKHSKHETMKFCRDMELQCGLRKLDRYIDKLQVDSGGLKTTIFKCLDQSMDIDDFMFELELNNISVEVGRGITFIDEKGNRHKGSAIDRELSLSNIKKHFNPDRGMSL